jgi:hypothetical protein
MVQTEAVAECLASYPKARLVEVRTPEENQALAEIQGMSDSSIGRSRDCKYGGPKNSWGFTFMRITNYTPTLEDVLFHQ